MKTKRLEVQHLEEELELLKSVAEMAFDDQHPIDFYIEQLKEKVDSRKHHLVKLKSQWYVMTVNF